MINLEQLQDEMIAAGHNIPLSSVGDTVWKVVNGVLVDLTPAERAVVTAHVPIPLPIHSTAFNLKAEQTTVGTTPVQLGKWPLPPMAAFDISVVVHAVDRGNGNVKKWRREAFIKRLAGAPVVVGTVQTPTADVGDTGTSGWSMVPGFVGNSLIFTVTGANGRTIDWSLFADVRRFAPTEGS